MKARRATSDADAAPPEPVFRPGVAAPIESCTLHFPSIRIVVGGFSYLTEPAEILARLVAPGSRSPAALAGHNQAPPDGAAGIGSSRTPGFQSAGSHWEVHFQGNGVFHIADSLGARYLDYLFHHANVAISAYDLEVAIQPERATARSRTSSQTAMDKQAARACLRELERLRMNREEASEEGDLGGVDRLDGEIAELERQLENNGQPGDTGERSRNNVRKAIGIVLGNLRKGAKAERDFGQHIGQFVSMGYLCIYNQPR
jgi:hypothetical protein